MCLTVENPIGIFACHCLKRVGGPPDTTLLIQSAIKIWEFGIT